MAQPADAADRDELDPMTLPQPVRQARLLRSLAARLESDGRPLPDALEEALVEEMEDRLDEEAAATARAEQGDEPAEPWDQVKARLGL